MHRSAIALLSLVAVVTPLRAAKSNIVVILTDDQGYGDLGCHANPVVRTPRLDAFARQAVELTHFYVNPVCSPTRASLLTGRYCYRTGVTDTFIGRANMRPREMTLGELFKGAGYRTGLFGKWHLGDCHPMRPQDQGFQEVLVHRGGGITQPSDPPPGSHYLNPVLAHNGVEKPFTGYCSDIYTDAAIKFMEDAVVKQRPFITWLAFNAPHAPLEVQEADAAPYRAMRITPGMFPQTGSPVYSPMKADDLCKLYGMVSNVDANVGRILDALDRLKLADDTVVVFLSDNGPQDPRYNAGLRGLKGSCFEGGIRVPCFVRWPGKLKAERRNAPCAHVDLAPTLCAAGGIAPPSDRKIDGVNLLPYLRGEKTDLDPRLLFFQWHRGDEPQKLRAFAVRGPRYKLVQSEHTQERPWSGPGKFMLFDIGADSHELNDIADRQPEEVNKLKSAYERWFADVTADGFAPTRIRLGTTDEPVTRLTRQDWRGASGWEGKQRGYWEVTLPKAGNFNITVFVPKGIAASKVRFKLGATTADAVLAAGKDRVEFAKLTLPAGDGRLEAWLEGGEQPIGAWQVVVKRVE